MWARKVSGRLDAIEARGVGDGILTDIEVTDVVDVSVTARLAGPEEMRWRRVGIFNGGLDFLYLKEKG